MGIAALSTEHVVISAKSLEDWTGTEAVECIMNYGLGGCHISDLDSLIHATCSLYFLLGNPNSVMSPASSSQSEEQQYLEKLKQLSKYIEPLRRMINKIDKNEGEFRFMHFFVSSLL